MKTRAQLVHVGREVRDLRQRRPKQCLRADDKSELIRTSGHDRAQPARAVEPAVGVCAGLERVRTVDQHFKRDPVSQSAIPGNGLAHERLLLPRCTCAYVVRKRKTIIFNHHVVETELRMRLQPEGDCGVAQVGGWWMEGGHI